MCSYLILFVLLIWYIWLYRNLDFYARRKALILAC